MVTAGVTRWASHFRTHRKPTVNRIGNAYELVFIGGRVGGKFFQCDFKGKARAALPLALIFFAAPKAWYCGVNEITTIIGGSLN